MMRAVAGAAFGPAPGVGLVFILFYDGPTVLSWAGPRTHLAQGPGGRRRRMGLMDPMGPIALIETARAPAVACVCRAGPVR
jgi:hypothetical protein